MALSKLEELNNLLQLLQTMKKNKLQLTKQ